MVALASSTSHSTQAAYGDADEGYFLITSVHHLQLINFAAIAHPAPGAPVNKMNFKQRTIAERCDAAATCLSALGATVHPFFWEDPISDKRLAKLEARMGFRLPPNIRELFLQSSGAHFEWRLGPESPHASHPVSTVASGLLHWDVGDLLECEEIRREWVDSDFQDPDSHAHRLWRTSTPVVYLGDGNFLALDSSSHSGEAVVYLLSDLGPLHGTRLAGSFPEFVDLLSQLGCPGPDPLQLAPFIDPLTGLDVGGTAAAAWCSFLRGE